MTPSPSHNDWLRDGVCPIFSKISLPEMMIALAFWLTVLEGVRWEILAVIAPSYMEDTHSQEEELREGRDREKEYLPLCSWTQPCLKPWMSR